MSRFCPCLPVILVSLALALLGCSSDSQGRNDEAPIELVVIGGAEDLGQEIGETYLLMLADTNALLELNLPVQQLRPALRMLKDDYKVRFANLGCLVEALRNTDGAYVFRIADDYVSINGGQDNAGLTQARTRYGADAEIPALLSDIEGLRAYAFLDQLAREHPGETVLCN